MSYFMLYFDNLMKNLGVTNDNFSSQNLAKSREPLEVGVTPLTATPKLSSTARLRTILPQIFLKHLFLCYILII